jgi:hypothetical protein
VSEIDGFGLHLSYSTPCLAANTDNCYPYRALAGAGSVVTKSVPPRSVVVGNPARVIRTLPIKKEGEETEAEKRRKMLGL